MILICIIPTSIYVSKMIEDLNSFVKITVEGTGIGIDKEYDDIIFKKLLFSSFFDGDYMKSFK